jgi:hypothetical protein
MAEMTETIATPVSDVMLARYVAGDLAGEQLARVERAIGETPGLAERLERMKSERAAFLASTPPHQFAHQVVTRLTVERPAKAKWQVWWLLPPVTVATALLLGVVYQRALGPQSLSRPAVSDEAYQLPEGEAQPVAAGTDAKSAAPAEAKIAAPADATSELAAPEEPAEDAVAAAPDPLAAKANTQAMREAPSPAADATPGVRATGGAADAKNEGAAGALGGLADADAEKRATRREDREHARKKDAPAGELRLDGFDEQNAQGAGRGAGSASGWTGYAQPPPAAKTPVPKPSTPTGEPPPVWAAPPPAQAPAPAPPRAPAPTSARPQASAPAATPPQAPARAPQPAPQKAQVSQSPADAPADASRSTAKTEAEGQTLERAATAGDKASVARPPEPSAASSAGPTAGASAPASAPPKAMKEEAKKEDAKPDTKSRTRGAEAAKPAQSEADRAADVSAATSVSISRDVGGRARMVVAGEVIPSASLLRVTARGGRYVTVVGVRRDGVAHVYGQAEAASGQPVTVVVRLRPASSRISEALFVVVGDAPVGDKVQVSGGKDAAQLPLRLAMPGAQRRYVLTVSAAAD